MPPTYFEEDDIEAVLADLAELGGAVDVTIAGVTVKGARDIEHREVLSGEVSQARGKIRTVTIKTGSLPGLAQKVAITVEDQTFTVLNFGQIGDGAVTLIALKETPA